MTHTIDVETASGPARVTVHEADNPRGLLVVGPGASGSVAAPDLALAARTAHGLGVTAAIVEPPYAVAGRKVPPRGPAADAAWVEVVADLRRRFGDVPLVTGGRSFGSRVACRTASATGSVGVLCLAFPFHPPGKPEQTRLPDLEAAGGLPVLIIQGRSDPFGQPPGAPSRRIVPVDGDHGLKRQPEAIVAAVSDFLQSLLTR